MLGRLAERQAEPAAVIAPDKLGLPSLAALLILSACATAPAAVTGPTVAVLPGNGKSFDQFRADDIGCQQYARAQADGTTPDQGGAAQTSADKQRRYDLSYIQCMYARDHRVPVLGRMTVRPAQPLIPPPPSSPGAPAR